MRPADVVVLWSVAAVLPAGLGAFLGVERLGAARRHGERAGAAERLLGLANASAAGLMLGIAYAVLSDALARGPVAGTIGAGVGVCLVHLFGRLASTPERTPRVVAASALHSAAEGVAIGAAAASSVAFGTFLVLTFAFHNLSEGAVLGSALAGAGQPPRSAARAVTLARLGQPVLAVGTLAAVGAVPALLPWALGIAFGALVYLVLAELLPSSYLLTGRTSIAVVVSVAAGIVALLGGRTR